jgi:hypothetical protein
MKAKLVSLIITASLLLAAFAATPARAGANTTDYTGTMVFVGGEETPVVTPGGTMHMSVVFNFQFDTSDPRVSGIYVMTGKCTIPTGKEPGVWGPCQATWTLDVNGDQQPEWEGVLETTGRLNHDQYNATGHGLGEFAGLYVSFKVHDFASGNATVDGQVIGD